MINSAFCTFGEQLSPTIPIRAKQAAEFHTAADEKDESDDD
jgi:hypothetical protein